MMDFYTEFFGHTGREYTNQYVVPSHLRKELIYRLHNSKFAGQTGMTETIEKFRQSFFPNLVKFLIDYIRNCPSRLQVKPVKISPLQPPLQSVAAQQ